MDADVSAPPTPETDACELELRSRGFAHSYGYWYGKALKLARQLERELAEARAERDQYRVMWERDSKALGDAIGQRDTARAVAEDNRARYVIAERELAEGRRDAERYRWLRDVSVPPHNFYLSVPDEFADVRYKPNEVDEYIDAAIDAARAEEPQP